MKGDLRQLVLSDNIDPDSSALKDVSLGNVTAKALAGEGEPNGAVPAAPKARTVKVVFGPGTFVDSTHNR